MPIERLFFAWSRPAVESAVDFLVERFGAAAALDLSEVIVVVPVARAGRRLQECLVDRAAEEKRLLTPPEIATLGRLPELLYQPQRPFANALTQQLAWVEALRTLPAADRAQIVPTPPGEADLPGWLALGDLLGRLHRELAGDFLDFDGVARAGAALAGFPEALRWQALSRAQQEYLRILDRHELWDMQTARRLAVEKGEFRCTRRIVLLGTVDLNETQRRMLDQVAECVTAVVFAPEELADRFDAHGCLLSDQWTAAPIALADEQIVIAEGPAEQATAVARAMAAWEGRFAADEITIGVPEASLAPLIEQRLGECGVAARYGAGAPLSQSPPFRLLEAVAAYLPRRRFDALAALIRLPAMSQAVAAAGVSGDWLTALDTFIARHLPAVVDHRWLAGLETPIEADALLADAPPDGAAHVAADDLDDEPSDLDALNAELSAAGNGGPTADAAAADAAPVGAVETARRAVRAVEQLLAAVEGKRPLCEWGGPILDLVVAVFGGRPLQADDQADRALAAACRALGDVAQSLAAMPPALCPRVAAAEAIGLFLRSAPDATIPPPPDPRAVELLGWLDLPLDDAPALVVASLNEGVVPSALNADLFLPNQLRQRLGVEDNARRYARDAYALALLAASRRALTLVVGRRNLAGDPLFPSRLLFACPRPQQAARVRRFMRPAIDADSALPAGALRAGGGPVYQVPRPRPLAHPVESMSVSEFRDYLACPYRYYLKHRLRLRRVGDDLEELDGALFGSLAHGTLSDFAHGSARDSADAEEITAAIELALERRAERAFGPRMRAAVRIQVEQLRRRLQAFARWQASHAAAGWRIEQVEIDPPPGAFGLAVDGRRMGLGGRIDRIDRHADGRRLVIDYKTSDNARSPEEAHRDHERWIDLQLPLYRHLVAALKLDPPLAAGDWDPPRLQLAYLVLPKDAGDVELRLAPWSVAELEEADQKAAEVIRQVRAERFWPPTEPAPRGFEDYAAICLDDQLQARAAAPDEEGTDEA